MNKTPTTSPLTDEDRHKIQRWIFLLWKLYKGFLIAIAIVFGGGWLILLLQTINDNSLTQIFIIVSVVVLILFVFGWWSTPIYKRQTVSPLQSDLEENKKNIVAGDCVAIKRLNKYQDKLIFKEHGKQISEEFRLDCCGYSAHAKYPDAFISGKEIVLEYLPHSKIILKAGLLIPLTAEETATRKAQDRTSTGCIIWGSFFLLVGTVCFITVSLNVISLKNALIYGGVILAVVFLVISYITGNANKKD